MKKKFLVLVGVMVVFIVIGFVTSPRSAKKVIYNGNSLLISVDGENATNLPTSGNYYLTSYSCDSANTIIKWDRKNYKLTITDNKKGGAVSCDLEFNSSFPLNEAAIGSYINYEGYGGTVGTTSVACKKGGAATDPSLAPTAETESPNSCSGQNAHEDLDNSGYTYGFCSTTNNRFYVTGWRLAYLYPTSSIGNKPVIISAGSPECVYLTPSTGNLTFQKKIHALALKYCNTNFVEENCTCTSTTDGECDAYSGDAWALNNGVFNRITKNIVGGGGGYLYTAIDGAITCGTVWGTKACGYNNDLIDNGSNYWFAETWSSTTDNSVMWNASNRIVTGWGNSTASALGLRPVVSLSPSVYVVGGSGTMEEPYDIAINRFSINNGFTHSKTSNVTLRMSAMPGVEQMCISTASGECTEYIDFADTYSLDLGEDGEKTVYVYYKNSVGDVVASLTETVIVDTTSS